MRPAKPPYPTCWVYSKGGRKTARVMMEYLVIGGKDHGKTFVAVYLDDPMVKHTDRHITKEKSQIEYIRD